MTRSSRRALVAFAVAGTACWAPAQQRRSAELDHAGELLQSRLENEVTEGAQICATANSVPAVELLLDVLEQTERRSHLHLSPGHYRDIVWDSLVKITDHYARARVELELKQSKDPHVRQWCAELLGIYGEKGFGESVRKALFDKDDDVQRWAARSLGMLKFENAVKDLVPLTRSQNDYLRANAIEALAHIDAAHAPSLVAAIRTDKSGGVRCALLGAMPEVAADGVEAASVAALRDPDWRPRMQAVRLLGVTRTKGAVDALIAALNDGRPVVAARALQELQELTGQPIQHADIWQKWWADNRATFAFPETRGVSKREGKGTITYNGVPVDSDHVAFLLDKSFAMQERSQTRGMGKDAAAQDELQRVLEQLDDKLTFNVWNYHVEVDGMAPKPVRLSPATRKKALDFAKAESKGKAKDIWQALLTVVPDGTLDTVYLLSSGEPDLGLYVHWNRVTRHLADLNRFHMVVVHTVAYADNDWFKEQLEKIAAVTGGRYQVIK